MKSLGDTLEIPVSELYNTWGKDLRLKILTGLKGFSRKITSYEILKPGKASIDILSIEKKGKVQILGNGELKRFYAMSAGEKKEFTHSLSSGQPPCLIISKGLVPEASLKKACQKSKTPLFTTGHFAGRLLTTLESLLRERLTPFTTAHGVLLDVYGIGVLILGKSGIGKSESALDLISRGSKLISDDIVEIRKSKSLRLTGKVPERIKHLMEIRGVGIINIKELFGKESVMDRREIDMVIELVQWNPDTEYDRLGLDVNTFSILDVGLPYLQIPLSPGRNTATIIEVAARNQLLKQRGVHSAETFSAKHRELLSNNKN
jgi:HPr kinase/phosphorylase